MVASAAGALKGWQARGGRVGQRRVSCCQGCVAGSGVAGFGGWQPGWKHANDPLIPSRDIGPLTHASAGDPCGAARNMPSQLFDSTHNLCPLSFSLSLSLSLSPFLFARLSFLFLLRSFPPSSLSRFLSRLSNASLYLEPKFFVLFFCFYVSLFLRSVVLSFTFSFYRTFYSLRYRPLGLSQVQGWRACPATPRFVAEVPRDNLIRDFLEILHLVSELIASVRIIRTLLVGKLLRSCERSHEAFLFINR